MPRRLTAVADVDVTRRESDEKAPLTAEQAEARAEVLRLARRLQAAYQRVSAETAQLWAQSMLRRLPDVGRCAKAVVAAAEAMDELTLHRLHLALSAEMRGRPADESRQLAAYASGPPTQAQREQTSRRLGQLRQVLAGELSVEDVL